MKKKAIAEFYSNCFFPQISFTPLNNIIIAIIVLKGLTGSLDDKMLPKITPGIDPNNRLIVNR